MVPELLSHHGDGAEGTSLSTEAAQRLPRLLELDETLQSSTCFVEHSGSFQIGDVEPAYAIGLIRSRSSADHRPFPFLAPANDAGPETS